MDIAGRSESTHMCELSVWGWGATGSTQCESQQVDSSGLWIQETLSLGVGYLGVFRQELPTLLDSRATIKPQGSMDLIAPATQTEHGITLIRAQASIPAKSTF